MQNELLKLYQIIQNQWYKITIYYLDNFSKKVKLIEIRNMAKLTSRAEDYSKWYNELVVKADLAENSGVRGCMVIKPYGYAIWEK